MGSSNMDSTSNIKPSTGQSYWKKEVMEWIKTLALAFVIVFLLHHFVFNLSTVEGDSMNPTLQNKDWLFVNRAVYIWGEPDVGDIVVLKDPSFYGNPKEYLVKRVIGVPGDVVEVLDQELYINGTRIDESYINHKTAENSTGPINVPEGHYFVMGDNRLEGKSRDSRSFGTVPEDLIKGRAGFILWPITRLGGI